MAYLKNPLDDEKQQQQGQAATPSTSGVIDGQAQAGGNTGAPGAGANGADQRVPGTGFVNLQSYINANAGEGGRMVNQTNDGLIKDVNAYGTNAGKAAADTAKALAAQNGAGQVGKLKSGIVNDASATQSAAKDFLGRGVDTTGAQNATSTLGATQADLDGRLNVVDDPGTQVDKLNQTYGKGPSPYSKGFSSLDQFLVQGSKDGQGATAALKGRTADVDSAYGASKSAIDKAADDAKKQLATNQAAVRTTAKNQIGTIESRGQKKVADINRGLDTENYDGTQTASLGDALNDGDRADLAALAAIAGGKANGAWKATTYNPGTKKAPPPIDPITQDPLAGSGVSGGGTPDQPRDNSDVTFTNPGGDPGGLLPDWIPAQPDAIPDVPEWVPEPPKLDLKKKWCLVAGTPIEMVGQPLKAVEQLRVGDEVAEGGRVTEVLPPQLSDSVFDFGGVLVAEGHAVLVDGVWTRIGKVGTRVLGTFLVYPVNTEHHVLIADGLWFADHQEVDGIEDDDACLEALNSAISKKRA